MTTKPIIAALVAFAAAIALVPLGAQAQEGAGVPPEPTVDFSISIPGAGCDTATVDTKCQVTPGQTFMLEVRLDSFTTANGTYESLETAYTNSAAFTHKITGGLELAETVKHPNCSATKLIAPDRHELGCAFSPPSSYTGITSAVPYNCQAGSSGTFTLITPPTNIESKGVPILDLDGNETLTVNCVDPATLVGGAQADLAGAGTPSHATGAIAGASVAGAIVVAGIAWNLRRRSVSS
jgi:hypothetical protein